MREEFDYGCDLKHPNEPKQIPTEGEFTGLIDADSIPYLVGFSRDHVQYLQAKNSGDFYNHPHWINAIYHATHYINTWMARAECDSALFYVTDSENNFRHDVATTKEYKGSRSENKPPFFYEVKQWLIDFHKAKLSDKCEADDEISIEAWRRIKEFNEQNIGLWNDTHKKYSNFCVISSDKDLNIIPTWHLNAREGDKFWVNPLGSLDPVYKEKEVNDYKYWPVFQGTPVNIEHCSTANIVDGKAVLIPFCDHPCSTGDPSSIFNFTWIYSKGSMNFVQDSYLRGKDKGKGKFKRVNLGKIKVDVIDRLKGSGLKFFYSQILTGDTADDYGGLKGIGASTAFNALNDCRSERELYDVVLKMYRKRHRHLAEERMLEQAQLAWMQTYEGEQWKHLSDSRTRSFPL